MAEGPTDRSKTSIRPLSGAVSRPTPRPPIPSQPVAGPGLPLRVRVGLGGALALVALVGLATVRAAGTPPTLGAADIAQVARSQSPALAVGRALTWSGVVESVDRDTGTLIVRADHLRAAVAVPAGMLAGLATGDRVEVAGQLSGRSRFGSFFIGAREVRKR